MGGLHGQGSTNPLSGPPGGTGLLGIQALLEEEEEDIRSLMFVDAAY